MLPPVVSDSHFDFPVAEMMAKASLSSSTEEVQGMSEVGIKSVGEEIKDDAIKAVDENTGSSTTLEIKEEEPSKRLSKFFTLKKKNKTVKKEQADKAVEEGGAETGGEAISLKKWFKKVSFSSLISRVCSI
jgi:divalent metal cation (Fe/Co/Zn/Cd) transporter